MLVNLIFCDSSRAFPNIVLLIFFILSIKYLIDGIKLLKRPKEFAWFSINFASFRSNTHANGYFMLIAGIFTASLIGYFLYFFSMP